jgi:hypothetical protein
VPHLPSPDAASVACIGCERPVPRASTADIDAPTCEACSSTLTSPPLTDEAPPRRAWTVLGALVTAVVLVIALVVVGNERSALAAGPHKRADLGTNRETTTTTSAYDGPPDFTVTSAQFTSTCSYSCDVAATLSNAGGPGSGTVMFTITGYGGYTTLATCTAYVYASTGGGTETASCSATSYDLSSYVTTYPYATPDVTAQVTS